MAETVVSDNSSMASSSPVADIGMAHPVVADKRNMAFARRLLASIDRDGAAP